MQSFFLTPNRPTREPKNKLIMADVTKRQLSLIENKLRLIPNASVIADKYRPLLLLQNPRQTKVIRKQTARIIHL